MLQDTALTSPAARVAEKELSYWIAVKNIFPTYDKVLFLSPKSYILCCVKPLDSCWWKYSLWSLGISHPDAWWAIYLPSDG